MQDVFIIREWEKLCERLMSSAQQLGETTYIDQATEFCAQETPRRYPEFLSRVRAASQLAWSWQEQETERRRHEEELVDEALDESFPASDPAAWPTSHV